MFSHSALPSLLEKGHGYKIWISYRFIDDRRADFSL